jgi:tetratricopeptide (TPR) repeat protein
MKTLIVLAVFAFGSPIAFSQSAGQQAEAFYKQGVAAEKAGDPAAAAEAFQKALALNPNHANARYRAGQVRINAATMKAGATEAKIGAVVIPVYQLEEATVREAIDALSLAMDKVTEGKVAPNFVLEDPKNKLAETRISLQLKNVPAKAILDYIHSQSSTRARYDEHAVVIMPR